MIFQQVLKPLKLFLWCVSSLFLINFFKFAKTIFKFIKMIKLILTLLLPPPSPFLLRPENYYRDFLAHLKQAHIFL